MWCPDPSSKDLNRKTLEGGRRAHRPPTYLNKELQMPFPPTRRELTESGYDFIAHKTCPCGSAMELWHTPQGKMMPMDPMPADDSPAVSHWGTCSKASQFRRKPPTSAVHHKESPEGTQSSQPIAHVGHIQSGDLFPSNPTPPGSPRPDEKG